jgi:hypothetical protein
MLVLRTRTEHEANLGERVLGWYEGSKHGETGETGQGITVPYIAVDKGKFGGTGLKGSIYQNENSNTCDTCELLVPENVGR